VLTWLNGRIYNDLSHVDGSRSLYKQLRETFGYSPANATERYTPVCCDSRTAGLLNIKPGAPLFRIERVARDLDDVVLEYSVTHTLDASLSLQIATSQSSMSQQWACTIEKGR
jgi:GntR family transcriptional regulator